MGPGIRTPAEIRGALLSEPLLQRLKTALADESEGIWVVGGAVRDAALSRTVADLDLAVAGDPSQVAASAAEALDGFRFEMSAGFGTWRIVPRREGEAWQVDVTALRGEGIEGDLAGRDFTVGAIAMQLAGAGLSAGEGGELLDPFGGLVDLAEGQLRVVSRRSFSDDPLRLLRAARIAAQLSLTIEPETEKRARALAARATEPAGERCLEELRLLVGGPDPKRGLALLETLGLMGPILPELAALHGVKQGPNHHLDVFGHTLEVLDGVIAIQAAPESLLDPEGNGESAELVAEVSRLLAEPLADQMSRGDALRFGALFHDLGKPETRTVVNGFTGFPGHDRTGATVIAGITKRLAASRKLSRHLQDLALYHLKLGFLIPEMPLGPRQVHHYLRSTGEVCVDVTLLTVADRLAARGSGGLASDAMVDAHLNLARQMVAAGMQWRREGPPSPLLRGDELARELGIQPGPELGPLVAELEAAQFAGEVGDRGQAVTHMRKFAAR